MLGVLEAAAASNAGEIRSAYCKAASLLGSAEWLRRDLGLNHADAVLAYELLAWIEELKARLESLRPPEHNHDEHAHQPAPPGRPLGLHRGT